MNNKSFSYVYKFGLHILLEEGLSLEHAFGPSLELFGGDALTLAFSPTDYRLERDDIPYAKIEHYAEAIFRDDADSASEFQTLYASRLKATEAECIDRLSTDSNTCRAMQSVLNGADGQSRVNSLHWAIRDGELNLHVHMCTSEFFGVLPIDVCIFAKYYRHMQSKLGYRFADGTICISFGSMHIFERDIIPARKYLFE